MSQCQVNVNVHADNVYFASEPDSADIYVQSVTQRVSPSLLFSCKKSGDSIDVGEKSGGMYTCVKMKMLGARDGVGVLFVWVGQCVCRWCTRVELRVRRGESEAGAVPVGAGRAHRSFVMRVTNVWGMLGCV
jgi:hypothetical protein